jgi:hypothetical protein
MFCLPARAAMQLKENTMPLDLIVENLDNVPTEMRGNYVKQSDGKYQLDLRDLEPYVESQLQPLKSDLENTREHERKLLLEDGLTAALQRAGVTQNGLDLLTDRLSKRVALDTEGGKRVVRIAQAGNEMLPMAGSGEGGHATLDDLVKEAVKSFPSMFKTPGKGEMPAPSEAGGSGAKTIARSDFDKLSPRERAAKMDKGFTLVDLPAEKLQNRKLGDKQMLRSDFENLGARERAAKMGGGFTVVD